jgi:hypothetical protein
MRNLWVKLWRLSYPWHIKNEKNAVRAFSSLNSLLHSRAKHRPPPPPPTATVKVRTFQKYHLLPEATSFHTTHATSTDQTARVNDNSTGKNQISQRLYTETMKEIKAAQH